MFSSEQKFSVNGSEKERLKQTLQLALGMSGSKVQAFNTNGHSITFYWLDKEGMNKLPKTDNIETIINIVWDHLTSDEAKESFASEPRENIDGSIEKGWEVFLPNWNDDDPNHFYAIFAVKLAWLYYAK